ncbi:MAG: DUF308 domain-containing protein [Thermomicrobiales bacterium]
MKLGLMGSWWSFIARGVLAIGFGLLAWIRPEFFWASVLLVFGVYAIVDGVLALATAVRGKTGSPWANVLEGLAGIIIGILALSFPNVAGLTIVVLIGCWAIVTGALEIISAIRLRAEIADEWFLSIGGVLSLLLGVILVLRPEFGNIVTAYILGTYALIFGVLMIGLGLRMKGLHAA